MVYLRPFLFAFLSAFVAAAPCAPLPAGHDQLKEEPDKGELDSERGGFLTGPGVVASAGEDEIAAGASATAAAPAPAPASATSHRRRPGAAFVISAAERALDQRADVAAGLRGLPPPVMHAAF